MFISYLSYICLMFQAKETTPYSLSTALYFSVFIPFSILFPQSIILFFVIFAYWYSFLLLLFKYSCLHFPPPPLPPTPPISISYPQSYPLWLCLCVLYTCSLKTLPSFSPMIDLLPPLWSLSVCSLFPCLWFYFACLFVLFIRFCLKLRSMVFVFHCLAYFTKQNALWFYTCCPKG